MPDPVEQPPEDVSALDPEEAIEGTFAETYRANFLPMARLAYLLTSSREAAEDIVQESFVKLHRHWRKVEHPRPYLRRIVVNACHSYHRRRQREHELPTTVSGVVHLHADEISDALSKLPYRQKAALVLRYYHDLSEADIGEVLGCRPGTVGSLIHRGLRALRGAMEA